MIRPNIVNAIRASTCAVVRMDERHEEFLAKRAAGSPDERLKSTVVATAFLVRDKVALTNRHVVRDIHEEDQSVGHHEHWYLEFAYRRPENNSWGTTHARIKNIVAFVDPTGEEKIDVGFLQFARESGEAFESCTPVQFGDLTAIIVGADIGVCGYPLGNELLTGRDVWRFGPVVHGGIISGVAPFEVTNPRHMTAFLTDMNSAEGMSGAPVFTPDDGKVIGLHYSGTRGTVGMALPIDQARVEGWLRFYDRIFQGGENPPLPILTGGGDILE